MTVRLAVLCAAVVLGSVGLTGCDDEPEPAADPAPAATSDAGCATLIPDSVFAALGWTSPSPATYTVRGCHRETEQGYVEVRRRTGRATSEDKARRVYDDLCAGLDRTGPSPAPGATVGWLGEGVTACAVEPRKEVGQTKVVVLVSKHRVAQFAVAAVAATPRDRVRAALKELVQVI